MTPAAQIVLHASDNLTVLRTLPDLSVDLVYLDPPFFTQRVHTGRAGSFDDRWPSLDEYLAFMRERLIELRRVLVPSGSLYLHCDPTASHYLRIVGDGVFGARRFVNAITWQRTAAHSSARRRLPAVHDTILVWGKTATRRYWRAPPEPLSDLWLDIGLASTAKERVGYPTQKPVALLERIIAASCPPGGVVLDPFCGSGTTLVAANLLGRRGIGIDSSAVAVALTCRRLADAGNSLVESSRDSSLP